MKTAVTLIVLAIVGYVVVDFVREWRKAEGSLWDRLVAAGKGSATILWARFTIIVGALADLLVEVADWLNAPGVADGIKMVLQPEYVGAFIVAVALISEVARRRTLGKE
jgi:hypothetical protein